MKFRTEIEVKQTFELNPDDQVVTLGSCFADKLAGIFQQHGLPILANPFGVIYNPVSLAQLLLASLNKNYYDQFWEEQNGIFVNLYYHGSMSHRNREEAIKIVYEQNENLRNSLGKAKLLIVTFGTAFGYEDLSSSKIVTNCHRFPSTRFRRRLLSQDEMFSPWLETIRCLREVNPKLKILFSISPVRYVRDSLVENQLSKANLLIFVHQLLKIQEDIHYFPAYEIMLDDLRDYRFYEADLVQPNSQALNYILEKFAVFCFSSQMKKYWQEAEDISRLIGHKTYTEDEGAKNFLVTRQEKIFQFKKKYPFSTFPTIISI